MKALAIAVDIIQYWKDTYSHWPTWLARSVFVHSNIGPKRSVTSAIIWEKLQKRKLSPNPTGKKNFAEKVDRVWTNYRTKHSTMITLVCIYLFIYIYYLFLWKNKFAYPYF